MNKEQYLESVKDMIYLIYCAVNNNKPQSDKVQNMNIENIYETAEHHMLTAVTAAALESAGVKEDNFTQSKGKAYRKNAMLDIERKLLFKYLDDKGIWYMPLKGAVMKDYYPTYGMRQMSDNDILFDPEYRAAVKEYFESHGYEVREYEQEYQDIYLKAPVSNFEMHVGLFHPRHALKYPEIYNYYQNVKERLIKSKNGCEYHFSNEDFYIYMTAHEYKHYSAGGTGLRSLLDIYIFMKKFGDTLDMEYIKGELKKLGIEEFELQSRNLAMNLFGSNKLTDKDYSMFEYIVFSGTYGNRKNIITNKIKRTGSKGIAAKTKYLWGRLFPPIETLKISYPVFYKYKILLVFLPFYRFTKIFTVSKSKVKNELKVLSKYK